MFKLTWRILPIAILLAACGGGSGTSTTPVAAAPVSPVTTAPVAPVAATPDTTTPATPAATVLTLPIEVLGNGSPRTPVIADAALGVASARLSTVTQLWFQCHRCGFYGAPEFEAASDLPVKIKASIRVLGGAEEADIPWITSAQALPWPNCCTPSLSVGAPQNAAKS